MAEWEGSRRGRTRHTRRRWGSVTDPTQNPGFAHRVSCFSSYSSSLLPPFSLLSPREFTTLLDIIQARGASSGPTRLHASTGTRPAAQTPTRHRRSTQTLLWGRAVLAMVMCFRTMMRAMMQTTDRPPSPVGQFRAVRGRDDAGGW